MKIGYVRVSTVEQHEERQIIELKEKANVERIYKDKLSGKNTERPQLRAMIDFAREGDTIYVSEFSRLARSTKDLLSIIQDLREKGVQVISLKENFDTSTPAGELAMTVFAAIATFERKIMLQRQAEARRLGRACQEIPEPRDPLRLRTHAHLPCLTPYRLHVAERKRRSLPGTGLAETVESSKDREPRRMRLFYNK